jgi:RNA-directed DNA polymerase
MSIPFTYRHRPYIHFDLPLSTSAAESLATSPERVTQHAFFPFIFSVVEARKIGPLEAGGFLPKPPKRRTIAYAGHADSHIFAHYSDIIRSRHEAILAERGLTRCVTAFRELDGHSNIHHAREVFDFIASHPSCSSLAMDVSDFFGTLDHTLLKQAWCDCMGERRLAPDHFAVFRAITRYCQIEKDALFDALHLPPNNPRMPGSHRLPLLDRSGNRSVADNTNRLCAPHRFREWVRKKGLIQINNNSRGIPQGSPISAVLSNIYMLEMDTALNAFASLHGGLYRRYCDDILLVVPNDDLRNEAERLVTECLQRLRLQFNSAKTERVSFGSLRPIPGRPLQYLGFTFDGKNKRLRPSSVARFYHKMHRGVRRAVRHREAADESSGAETPTPLKKKLLYRRYSYLGMKLGKTKDERRNFLSYAYRAAEIMGDPGIKKQVKNHWQKLKAEIEATSA